jgi:hypothetical protein
MTMGASFLPVQGGSTESCHQPPQDRAAKDAKGLTATHCAAIIAFIARSKRVDDCSLIFFDGVYAQNCGEDLE